MKLTLLTTLLFLSTQSFAQTFAISVQDTMYVDSAKRAVSVKKSEIQIKVGEDYVINGIGFRIDRDMSKGYWLQVDGREYYRKLLEEFDTIISAHTRKILIARN